MGRISQGGKAKVTFTTWFSPWGVHRNRETSTGKLHLSDSDAIFAPSSEYTRESMYDLNNASDMLFKIISLLPTLSSFHQGLLINLYN